MAASGFISFPSQRATRQVLSHINSSRESQTFSNLEPKLADLESSFSSRKNLKMLIFQKKSCTENAKGFVHSASQPSISVEALDSSAPDCLGQDLDSCSLSRVPSKVRNGECLQDNSTSNTNQSAQAVPVEQRQHPACLAQKRHSYLIKLSQMYYEDKHSADHLGHYWAEILPYCVSNYLDLSSVLHLRRCCKRLYHDRRYAVSNISFDHWSTLTEKEIMSIVLPQFRTFLTAGSFAQLNFSKCCLLTDSFPKSLIQYDQQKLCRFIKALIFDFCYALSDKSLGILFSASLPNIEALSLRCARSRDLTGSPFSTHLSKANWPRFHQLSCSCTQITLPHIEAAARFITEQAIEMGTSPKLGLAGSSASYSLIRRLRLEKEHQNFIDAIIHTRSVEKAEIAIHAFETEWAKALEDPEHKGRVLHRLVRNRAVAILVNAPYSVAIIHDCDDRVKWIVTRDQRATALWKNPAPSITSSTLNLSSPQCTNISSMKTSGEVFQNMSNSSKNELAPSMPISAKPVQLSELIDGTSTLNYQMKLKESKPQPNFQQNVSENSSGSEPVTEPPNLSADTTKDQSNQGQPLVRLISKTETLPDDSTQYSRWMYPLPLAIRTRHLEMVKLLVENGAYVDVWGYNFATPLYIACSTDNVRIAELEQQDAICPNLVSDNVYSSVSENNAPNREYPVNKAPQVPNTSLTEKLNTDVETSSHKIKSEKQSSKSRIHSLQKKTGLSSDPDSPISASAQYKLARADEYDERFTSEQHSLYNSTSSVTTTLHENDIFSRQSSDIHEPSNIVETSPFKINMVGDGGQIQEEHTSTNMKSECYNLENSLSVPDISDNMPHLPANDLIHRQFTFGIGLLSVPPQSPVHEDEERITPLNIFECRADSMPNPPETESSEYDHKIVKYLLEHGAPVDPPELYSNKCPVSAAIKHRNLELLELLISKGARLNVRSLPPESISTVIQHSRRHQQKRHGESQFSRLNYKSPLFWACEVEAWDCVALLLKHGANPHWRDPFSHRSLTPALLAYRRNPSILPLFIRHNTGASKETRWVLSEVLGAAILYDDLKTAEYLVTTYPDLLEQGSNGMWSLPLIQASRLDKIEMVQLLLKLGADPNAVNQEGLTSLHLAANEGRKAIVECLLQHGALPSIKGGIYGKTPLHIAVEENFASLVLFFLEHGAPITIKDHAGHTPLMTAIAARNDKVALLLIETAVTEDLDILDSAGRSALMYAIYFGQFKVAYALVEKGVRCKIVDPSGASAESLLRAKINSFGKTTSILNKFFRNIVGGQQMDQGGKVREGNDAFFTNNLFDRCQNMSSAALEEMNVKRKKTAQALLKKIHAVSSKKQTPSKQSSPSLVTPVQHSDKNDISKEVKMNQQAPTILDEHLPVADIQCKESLDVPGIQNIDQFPEWDFYGFETDYELESEASMSDMSDAALTSKGLR